MTIYPVYDCARHDFTRDVEPIGYAASEPEAWSILKRHFAGSEVEFSRVELNDIERRGVTTWGWWPVHD